MSIRAFYGFDGVGQGVQGSSGDAMLAPLNGAGVTGTRNQPLTIKLYNVAAHQYNAVGVTGLEQHKVGKAGERRNALVLYRNSYAISFTSGATVNLLENFEGRTDKPWRSIVGFTWADFSATNPTVAYWLARVSRNTSYFNLIQRRNYDALTIAGKDFPIERNREYYIEVEMFCDNPVAGRSSNPTSCRVWIDGQLAGEWIDSFGAYASNASTLVGLEVGYVAHASNPLPLYMGVADVYVLDGTGESPYNERLGTQKVRTVKPSGVVEDRWVPVGTSDALAALTDGSDATGLKSPKGSATGVLELELGLNSKSIVNGLLVYGRGMRDNGAQRQITSKIEDLNGELVGEQHIAYMGPSLNDVVLVDYLPSRTLDMSALNGNHLSNVTVDFKVD